MFNLSIQWLVVALDVSVKAVLLAGTAALVLRLPRLRDSNLHHRAWTGVLIGMLLLPVLSRTVPALQLPFAVPDAWHVAEWDDSQPAATIPTPPDTLAAQPVPGDISRTTLRYDVQDEPFAEAPRRGEPWQGVDSFTPPDFDVGAEIDSPALAAELSPVPAWDVSEQRADLSDAVPALHIVPAERPLLARWPMALVGLWLVGTSLMALRILAGLVCSWRLVRSSTAITAAELIALGVDPRSLDEKRATPIGECPLIRVPLALGVLRPRIMLPSDWPTWSAEKLQAVIAHERTHIERGDAAVIFLAELNRCLYWFHPLAWWLRTHLSRLAETACDDAAIDSTGDRTTYARHLLEVAAAVSGQRSRLVSPGISMARPSNIETRINTILDITRPLSQRLTWTSTLLLLATIVPLITLAAAVRPSSGDAAIAGPEPTATISAEQLTEPASTGVDSTEAPISLAAATDDSASDRSTAEPQSEQPSPSTTTEDDSLLLSIEGIVLDPDGKPVSDATVPVSYSGHVTSSNGEPIADAKVWLAVASYDDEVSGSLQEVATSDAHGRFQFHLDAATVGRLRKRGPFARAQLVAMMGDYGLDWMPLGVFEDNPTPSDERDTLQARLDKALGDGRFASRTLKLRPEARPIRGRLVALEGHPLPNVTVLVEGLRQPDIPRLLKAFEMSWKRELNEAFSATSVGVGGLARSELQKLIPPVTTDENGEFELRGIGDDQLVTLTFDADRVEARPVHVLGREMETVSLPHTVSNPGGAKDVFVGRDFTYAVGPSVPVEGVVTDYDTGEPVAGVLVYVERLFKEGSVNHVQFRLDTHHMRAVTDGKGRFRITGMPPGERHVLEAVPQKSEPYLSVSRDVSLSLEDGDVKRIEIQVKRGIWIEGRVTDKQSGEPLLAAVDYMALKKNPHSLDELGLDLAWVQQRYRTDSNGRYRVLGLPGPGVLLVTSQVPGYPLGAGAETIDGYQASDGFLPTTPFRPRVSNWHLLKQIDPATDAISLTCDLVLDAGVSILGRVVGPDGQPISDFYVLGQTEGDEWWRPRHDDNVRTTDRFTVYGYDGKGPRQLFFKNQDETLVGQYRLEGDAAEEIVVTLQPSVRVTGRLIENETDLPAARYFLFCEKCSLFNEKYPPVKFRIHWCFTDDEGRFEIKGLMAGLTYKMNALNGSNFANNRNRFTIDLTAAKPGDVIALGDVTGPNSSLAGNMKRAEDGTKPEKATTTVSSRERNPAKTAASNQTNDTVETPKRAAKVAVTGKVIDEHRQTIEGAQVWLAVEERWEHGPAGAPVITHSRTDSNGRYAFSLAQAVLGRFVKSETTRYHLWVHKPEYAVVRTPLSLESRDELVETVMKSAPVVTMTIRKPDGSACSGARIVPTAAMMEDDAYVVIPEVVRGPLLTTSDAEGRVQLAGLEHQQLRSIAVDTSDFGRQGYYFNSRTSRMPTELTLGLVGRIEGRLELPEGGQADLTRVKLRVVTMSTTEHDQREYRTGESILQPNELGEFSIPAIREGTVRVWVDEPENFGYRADPPAESLIVTGGQTATLLIPMRKAVQVVRLIRDAKTQEPVPGVRVNMQLGVQHISERTGPDGRFRAWILPGKRYHTVYDLPSEYISQNIDSWRQTVAFENTNSDEPVEFPAIELVRGRTIEGVVVDPDGSPLPGVRVGADWTDPDEDFGSSEVGAALNSRAWATTDIRGRFAISGVHPDVSVTLTPVRTGILLGPSTTIEPNQDASLRLETRRFEFISLSGRVLDWQEKPIAKATVVVEYRRGSEIIHAHRAVTDNAGRFRTPPYLPRNLTYRIAVLDARGSQTIETSPWQNLNDANTAFEDVRVDRDLVIEQ